MQRNEWDLPQPPGIEPVKGPHVVRWLVLGVLAFVLFVAAFRVSIPIFYVFLPGPARDVERLVVVKGEPTYSSEGSLFLTTVSEDISVTFVDLVEAWIDPHKTVVDRSQVTGGQSFSQVEKEQKFAMEESKVSAEQVALDALGLRGPTGAKVVNVLHNTPAEGTIEKDDVITAVDGNSVATTCDVTKQLHSLQVGDRVSVTVRRGTKTKTLRGIQTTRSPIDNESPFLGIQMEELVHPGFDITFKTGNIVGPSAGMMFSLGLYDALTPGDLTAGKKIAGTGTIDCNGTIGPIGGIEEKVAGAEAAGAEIFLAPSDEAGDARTAAGNIKIVPVKTFDDALQYLQALSS
ncbi:MAG: Lon-like protease [Actinomycetota bacterium]|jgi:PDZ domain-containing protein|nr:Lon-like protease [Actinomycetota bacterium]